MGLMERVLGTKKPTTMIEKPCPLCKRFGAMGREYARDKGTVLIRCERCGHTWSADLTESTPQLPDRVVFSEPELPRMPGDPKTFADCPTCWRQHVGTGTEVPTKSAYRVHFKCRKCQHTWTMDPDDRPAFHTPEEVREWLGTKTSVGG